MPTSETNRALWRSVPEKIFNERNYDLVDEVFGEDYIEHAPIPPGYPSGRESVKHHFKAVIAAFPDAEMTVNLALADDDEFVAGYITVRGTHLGTFMGIPATGRTITWTESHFGRIAEGQVREHWADIDRLGMMMGLGVIPQDEPQPTQQ